MKRIFVLTSFIALLIAGCQQLPDGPTVRFATFNTALYRHDSAMLKKDLEDSHNKQLRIIAEIIQRTRPDVLALQEFDYDASGHYLALFQDNFLSKPQNQADTILYRYRLPFPSNTGLNSGLIMTTMDTRAIPAMLSAMALMKASMLSHCCRAIRLILWLSVLFSISCGKICPKTSCLSIATVNLTTAAKKSTISDFHPKTTSMYP